MDEDVSARLPASVDFGVALTALMHAAGLTPDGVRRELRDRRHLVSRSALYDWKNARHLPEDDGAVLEVVRICLATARRRGVPVAPAPDDESSWRELLAGAKRAKNAHAAWPGTNMAREIASARQGALINEWDPIALGVHRAIDGDTLPRYVRRAHDDLLRIVLDPDVTTSRIVVLRGGSSTGKTRAAYEAIRECLPDWRIDRVQTRAILAARINDGVTPRTVVWLDELRDFADYDTAIFAELDDLLARTARVMVIATLWPTHWGAYTRYTSPPPGRPDHLAVLRRMLERLPELSAPGADVNPARGGVIDVPDRFTGSELRRAVREGNAAVIAAIRAAEAAGRPGMVAQYLAGVPDLEKHYAGPGADPYGHAVITAAMDLARLGHAGPYPGALLRRAVAGYLDDSLRTISQDDWWDKSLQYATRELRGTVSALAPIPPPEATGVAGYRIADYLEQMGRRTRAAMLGPASLWAALTAHATDPADLRRLGQSAYDRGRYRMAAALWKKAIEAGDARAAGSLLYLIHDLDPRGARHAAQWISDQVSLDSPAPVWGALDAIGIIGEDQIAVELAMRAVNSMLVHDLQTLAEFLSCNWPRRAWEAAASRALVQRLTTAPAGSVQITAGLLKALRQLGEHDAEVTLARQFIMEADLTDPRTAAQAFAVVGPTRQLLIDRLPVDRMRIDDTDATVAVLRALHAAGASGPAAVLARRLARESETDTSSAVDVLLAALHRHHGLDVVLLERVRADRVAVDRPLSVSSLYQRLRDAGYCEEAAVLGRRFAAEAPFEDFRGLATMYKRLRKAGDHESARVLVKRAVTERPLRRIAEGATYIWAAVELIGEFYSTGETEAALALARQIKGLDDLVAVIQRLPMDSQPEAARAVESTLLMPLFLQGPLDNPRPVVNRIRYLRWAKADGSVAALLKRDLASHVALDDPGAVGELLDQLLALRQTAAVAALLARKPVLHAAIRDPRGVAKLLTALRNAGATDDAAPLAMRAAAEVVLSDVAGIAALLGRLGDAGAAQVLAGRAAEQADVTNPAGAASLLRAFIRQGLPRQAAAFADRAAQRSELTDAKGVGELLEAMDHAVLGDARTRLAQRSIDAGFFVKARQVNPDLATDFKFGRELDGTASPPWTWEEL